MTVKLLLGDCLDQMGTLVDGSVDLVFTSPPYNLSNTSGGGFNPKSLWRSAALKNGYASHDDNMPHVAYVAWQKAVLRECWRLLSDTGAIYYNHKPRIQNGILLTPLDLNPDLPVRQIIIWKQAGGINFSPTFYLPTHEWIVIFAKPKFRLRNRGTSGLKDVWEVPQERNNPHPAPFPVELPKMALMSTDSRVVLDPFMGSGSTGIACLETGCDFIGIENDPGYFGQAERRLKEHQHPLIEWPARSLIDLSPP